MNFSYSRSRLRNDVNGGIQNRIDMLIDANRVINNAARDVMTDVDLASAKRKAPLGTGIFDRVNEYPAPRDLASDNIIDIVSEQDDQRHRDWSMTTNRTMNGGGNSNHDAYQKTSEISVEQHDGRKHILLSTDISDYNIVISTLDSVEDNGGSWGPVGDTDDVQANRYAYVKGTGSLTVDINDDNTDRVGIENITTSPFEIKPDFFDGVGSLFTWIFFPSTENINGARIRVGSDRDNFFEIVTDKQHDNTELETGWNLFRFDLKNAVETGSVDTDNTQYVQVTIDKDTELENVAGFRFDHVVLRVSSPQSIYYYSSYPWVSQNGAYKNEATSDTDFLVAGNDEYKLFELAAIKRAYEEAKEFDTAQLKQQEYQQALQEYKLKHPSEAMIVTEQYQEFHNPTVGDSNRIID